MSAVFQAREPSARYLSTRQPPLVEHFELLISAPDGIARLRELILSLAVRGRLVPQLPGDAPAAELLASIGREKAQWVADRKLRRQRPSAAVGAAEQPFELPLGWAWARLPDVSFDHGQSAPQADFSYIDVGAIDPRRGSVTSAVKLLRAADAPARARKRVERGTVLFSMVRPYLKNIAIVERDYVPAAIASTAFAVIHPHTGVHGKYLLHYLRSPEFTEFVARRMVGVAYPAISDSSLFQGLVPLPPSAEQARIVERVDELMRLCDALEDKALLDARAHALLLDTLLSALAKDERHDERAEGWRRVASHFDQLLDRPEAVDALESVLIRLALVGRLLPQAPQGWRRLGIGELATLVTDGTHKTPRYSSHGIKFVSAKDVRSGRLVFDDCKYVSAAEHERLTRRCRPQRGDILVSKSGSIGTVVLVDTDEEFSLFESLALIKYDQAAFVGEFLRLAIQDACDSLDDGHIKGVAVKHLHLNVLRRLEIPVPPLEDQRRIVAHVGELRALCAGLRERLVAAGDVRARLAVVLVTAG